MDGNPHLSHELPPPLSRLDRLSSGRDPRLSHRTAPNVIVVLVADLPWDGIGVAGYPFAEMPNVDRVAPVGPAGH